MPMKLGTAILKYRKSHRFDVAAPQTGHPAYPWRFYAAGKENYEELPTPEKQFLPRYLLAARKAEFELGGINNIRSCPELGMLEILSEFSAGKMDAKVMKKFEFIHKNF